MTVNDNVFPQYGNTTLREHLGITDADSDGLPDTPEMVERIYRFIIEEDRGVPLYFDGSTLVMYDRLVVESNFVWKKGSVPDLVLLSVQLPHSGDASKVAEGRVELEEDLRFLDAMGFEYNEISEGDYYVITDVGTLNPFTREEQFSALTDSMATSILVSVILCLVVMILMFRSAKVGVVAIIPMVLVVAWLYGFMEITGYYLNSVTVTIAAISIGVGVDYSIHVTQRFREEYEKAGEYVAAMNTTLRSTGNALTASAGSTMVGFLIIGLSPMTMFSTFGFLTAIMIGMAFVSAIFVLPAFLWLTVAGKEKPGGSAEK